MNKIQTKKKEHRMVLPEHWERCTRCELPDTFGDVKRKCWGGLYLGYTRGINALSLVFPIEKDGVEVLCFCFRLYAPIQSENGSGLLQPYGNIHITPGNVTDYDYIKNDINYLEQRYDIQSIALDRFNSSQLAIDLQNEGIDLNPHGMGFRSMNNPVEIFMEKVVHDEVSHDNNTIVANMMYSARILENPQGQLKISQNTIFEWGVSAPTAALLALSAYMRQSDEGVEEEETVIDQLKQLRQDVRGIRNELRSISTVSFDKSVNYWRHLYGEGGRKIPVCVSFSTKEEEE